MRSCLTCNSPHEAGPCPPLATRLRRASDECSLWDPDLNPPYSAWSALMEEAANALDEAEDDAPFQEPPEWVAKSDWVHNP